MRTAAAVFPAACLFSSALVAETTNNQSLSGTIQDSKGAVVPNATVTVVSEGTNLTRSAVSSDSGAYFISNLPLGFYNISATAGGFKKYQVSHFEITVGQQAALNVTLDIGNVNESVTVQADAVHVDTTSGEVSNLITRTQASQIQLNGRNFPQLLQLLPGVSTTYSSGFSLFGGYRVNNSGQSINGSRTDTFSWYLGTNYGGQRPNLVLPNASAPAGAARTQVFNPLAFALPAAGTFGNLGAYALYMPFFANWDVSTSKAFPIGEKVQASLRAELYNFPNHFSYNAVSNVLGTPTLVRRPERLIRELCNWL